MHRGVLHQTFMNDLIKVIHSQRQLLLLALVLLAIVWGISALTSPERKLAMFTATDNLAQISCTSYPCITATPTSINFGQSYTLSWNCGPGFSIAQLDVDPAWWWWLSWTEYWVATSGSKQVTPLYGGTDVKTIYCGTTLSSSANSKSSVRVQVTVPPPVVNFSASAATINLGESTNLTWTTQYAYACDSTDFPVPRQRHTQ